MPCGIHSQPVLDRVLQRSVSIFSLRWLVSSRTGAGGARGEAEEPEMESEDEDEQ